ncbi:hypothetical protein WMF38_44180 [Sorangium sp. So ce118]
MMIHERISRASTLIGIAALLAGAGCAAPGPLEDPSSEHTFPIGINDENGLITMVGLAGTTGEPLASYMSHHPVRVSVTIEPTTAVAPHRVLIGLVEKETADVEGAEVRTCLLGEIETSYGVADDGTSVPVTIKRDVVIPADCLADGAQSGIFNLWVSVDPLMEDDPTGFADYNTQFFNAAALDMNGDDRNTLCTGPNGEPHCIVDVPVTASGGHNIEASRIALESHIGAIDASCSLDAAVPLISLNGELRIFGSAAHDGVTEDEEADNTLAAAAGPDAAVGVTYAICPRGQPGADGAAPCAPGTTYAPLKIGNAEGAGDLSSAAAITHLVTGEPHVFNHALHAEPGGDTCGRLNGAPGASQNWTGYATFNLRMCAAPPFAETRSGGDAAADNCVVEPMQIVHTASAPDEANSLRFLKRYDQSFGNSVVKVAISLGTDSNLNLSGATTHNWAQANLGGWFSKSLVNVWADGAAYVSLVGSNANAGVEIFGTRHWQYQKTLNDIHAAWNPSFSKSFCLTYNYGLLGLGLNLQGCLQGTAGISVTLDVVGKDARGTGAFASSTRIGEAVVVATPHASLNVTLSAYVNIGIAKGGVTGSATLLGVSLPTTATLRWGLVSGPSLVTTANTRLDLTINTLGGSVRGWVDARKPAWCRCGRWCGYPCTKWSNIYNADIARWSGSTSRWNLLSQSGQWTLL